MPDRIFTTSVVCLSGNGSHRMLKKILPLSLKKHWNWVAMKKTQHMTGINGGHNRNDRIWHGIPVLSVADTVIDAVKDGAIQHFFLVGGCDGARTGRNYYTEFVENRRQKTP